MRSQVVKALVSATKLSAKEIENLIEVPPSPELGDYAFPCFILAKKEKKNPVEIARELSKKISSKGFESVKAAGPYVNFFLNKTLVAQFVLSDILKKREKYGSRTKSKKQRVMIEFSQANTHKAFHIGHVRGTSLGESIARITDFSGDKAIRVNYQGDTGMHVAKWVWCYKKFHPKEKPRKEEKWIASIYVDAVKTLSSNPKFQEEVEEINRKLESGEDKSLKIIWKKKKKLSLDSLEVIYKELNTFFDKYYFESELEKRAREISEELVKKNIAEISEEATIIRLDKYGLGVWVLLRKDGTVLYSAKDLALAERKIKEAKSDSYLYFVASEQDLHMKQLLKTLEIMNIRDAKKFHHVSYNLVRLPTGKMSSRTGDNILYSEFKKELVDYAKSEIKRRESLPKKELEKRALTIAISALKYSMLKQDQNKVIIFDKEEALSFEGNTGPYLLYTYARAKSILRKVKPGKGKIKPVNLSDSEKSIILLLSSFPEIVSSAYKSYSPNILANYSYSIAQKFNEFYHSEKVIGSESEDFRLALVSAFAQTLKNSLSLLGITVLEKM